MDSRIKQRDAMDCAAACIASVCRHYDKYVSVAHIRSLSNTTYEGTSVAGIISALTNLGFDAKAVRTDSEGLRNLRRPSIAHVINAHKQPHFVVVTEVRPAVIRVMDPASGRFSNMAAVSFGGMWTGVLIVIEPTERLSQLSPGERSSTRLLSIIRQQKYGLVKAWIGATLYTAIGIAVSYYLQYVVDQLVANREVSYFGTITVILVALFIVQTMVGFFKGIVSVDTGLKVDSRLILGYVHRLLHLPLSYYETVKAGELMSRIGDVVRIRAFLTETLIGMVTCVLMILFSLTGVFLFSPQLAMIALVFVPVYGGIYFITDYYNRYNERALIEASATFQSRVLDTVQFIRTIRQSNRVKFAINSVEKAMVDMQRVTGWSAARNLMSLAFADLSFKVVLILVIWVGTDLVLENALSIGQLVSAYTLTSLLSQPVATLIGANRGLQDAMISSDRLFEVNDLNTVDDFTGQELTSGPYELFFDGVSFHYPNSESVLEDITFRMSPGTVSALVGAAGCGKTTIASLAQMMYAPSSGAIYMNDHELKSVKPSWLRTRLAVVSQRLEIFNSTLMENIAFGDPNPDLNKVMHICSQLGMLAMIERLPAGFHTQLGECGARLSGGQQQQVVIARALYREPSILVLDEPTAWLDPASAELIHRCILNQKSLGKSVLVITHRLSTAQIADEILVLANKAIAERGTHDELMAKGGEYARLWGR